jgi:hypothetical protein
VILSQVDPEHSQAPGDWELSGSIAGAGFDLGGGFYKQKLEKISEKRPFWW